MCAWIYLSRQESEAVSMLEVKDIMANQVGNQVDKGKNLKGTTL